MKTSLLSTTFFKSRHGNAGDTMDRARGDRFANAISVSTIMDSHTLKEIGETARD